MTEAAWTAWVVDLARWSGWLVTHFLPSRTPAGRWRTAVQGHIGFPDLVLARDGVVIIVELKTDTGRLSPQQKLWLAALGDLAHVWRPRDRDHVEEILTRPRTRGVPAPHEKASTR